MPLCVRAFVQFGCKFGTTIGQHIALDTLWIYYFIIRYTAKCNGFSFAHNELAIGWGAGEGRGPHIRMILHFIS